MYLRINKLIPGVICLYVFMLTNFEQEGMISTSQNKTEEKKMTSFVLFSFSGTSSDEEREFLLSPEDRKLLLTLARESIGYWISHRSFMPIDSKQFSAMVQTPCGAFVTLHKKGNLRGCIGRFVAKEPLFEIVQQMAVSSAFNDYRFEPVEAKEMAEIDIEISVLTPLKRIRTIEEFQLGKHGIYIKKGYSSGTFLPQVAHDTGWSKEEFLGHCSRDKAGIGWDGWKDAELFTYEALVFGEKEQ